VLGAFVFGLWLLLSVFLSCIEMCEKQMGTGVGKGKSV